MLALICLGWKLSTRLEYWWLLLCTPRPPLLLPSFYLSLIFTPSIYPLYTCATFCLLNWFPASFLSPPFLPSSSRLSPDAAALCRPKFLSHPSSPSLSFHPSFYLTSLYLLRCSVYRLPATLSGFVPPPSRLLCPYRSLVFSPSAFDFLSFSIRLLSPSAGAPPITFLFPSSVWLFSALCELVPALCGSRGWWDLKSEVCFCDRHGGGGKKEGAVQGKGIQLRRCVGGVQPGVMTFCEIFLSGMKFRGNVIAAA